MPTESAREFVLTNTGATDIEWLAAGTEDWLVATPTDGTLSPAQSTSITVELDESKLTALAAGSYPAEIQFHDLSTSPPAVLAVPISLTVLSAQSSLVVDPPEGFATSGPEGGPFSPESKTYLLTNTGNVPFAWEATTSEAWVTIDSASSGTLDPGDSTQLQVGLYLSAAGSLSIGVHSAQLVFLDASEGLPIVLRDVTLSVLASDGWTEFTESPDTRVVYVSSSQGNDANDGLSAATPKRTIGAGAQLLRYGYPDWLLLRKGDTWNMPGPWNWQTDGRNSDEKQLLSSYGSGARPKIYFPAGSNGISTFGRSHVALVDIQLFSQTPYITDAGEGISPYVCSDILIEGCKVEGFTGGIVSNGATDSVVRRCVVYNAHNTGIFAAEPKNCLFEQNVVYRVGQILVQQGSTLSPHGFYISCAAGTTSYTVRGNIVSDVGYSGMDFRPDNGICDDNLIIRAMAGIDIGEGPCWSNFPQMTIQVTNNVIVDARNPFKSGDMPYGMRISQGEGTTIDNNILCNSGVPAAYGLLLNAGDPAEVCKDLTLSHNIIYNWGGLHLRVDFAPNSIQNLSLTHNDFQLADPSSIVSILDAGSISKLSSSYNRFYNTSLAPGDWFLIEWVGKSLIEFKNTVGDTTSTATLVNYKNPSAATISAYHASLGRTPTHEAFMAEAIQQSKDNWRDEYTAAAVNGWIRSCFDK